MFATALITAGSGHEDALTALAFILPPPGHNRRICMQAT